MAYTKYSLTPANNNAAPPDGAPEGMLPSAVNDTMRDMMAQIRDVGDGIRGGTYTMTAPVITGGSITGVALSGNTLTNPVITGGSINNTTVGATTANTGAFTTLGATGVATFSAGTVSAPAITTTGDTNTGIFFPAADTIAFTEGGVESVRIDSSGNVQVGGTTSRSVAGYKFVSILGTGAYTDYYSSTTRIGSIGCEPTSFNLDATSTNPMTFATNGSERMRIDSSGNLLVGTTTTTGRTTSFSLAGFNPATNITGAAFSATGSYGGGFASIDGTQGYVMWSQNSGADFYIRRATTTTGETGGVYISNAAGSWSAASDERLKNIIRPIENAVEKLKDYRCVIGEYKDNEGAERPFLIAQDVEKTFPEAVNVMDKENGYLGLSYTELTPLLVKAIQELNAKVTALETQLGAK